MKIKNLDAGFGRGKGAVVLKRTSHFALQAAGALVCIDVQHFLHVSLLWVAARPMQCLAYELKYIAIVGRTGELSSRDNPSQFNAIARNSQFETLDKPDARKRPVVHENCRTSRHPIRHAP
jgi:hypothetical protein